MIIQFENLSALVGKRHGIISKAVKTEEQRKQVKTASQQLQIHLALKGHDKDKSTSEVRSLSRHHRHNHSHFRSCLQMHRQRHHPYRSHRNRPPHRHHPSLPRDLPRSYPRHP